MSGSRLNNPNKKNSVSTIPDSGCRFQSNTYNIIIKMALRRLLNTVCMARPVRTINTSTKFHTHTQGGYQNRHSLFCLNQDIARICRDYRHGDMVCMARGYLAEYIKKADPIDWSRWIQYKADKYTKIQVVAPLSNAYSIYLLSWLPGQLSPIHGHPPGGCVMAVLRGTLEESVYPACKSTIYNRQIRVLTPGKIGYIDDSIGYHRIANLCNTPCNSIHIYFNKPAN